MVVASAGDVVACPEELTTASVEALLVVESVEAVDVSTVLELVVEATSMVDEAVSEEVVSDEVVVDDWTTSGVLELEPGTTPPEATLDDPALDVSASVKEPTKDDKVVSEPEEDEPDSPRLERVSVSDRLFC